MENLPNTEHTIQSIFSPERTLGHNALNYSSRQAAVGYELAMPGVSEERRNMLSTEMRNLKWIATTSLGSVRSNLTQYEGGKEAILARYLNSLAPQVIVNSIRYRDTLQNEPLSWNTWLADHASDDEILHLVQEHEKVLLQHAENEQVALEVTQLSTWFDQEANRIHEKGYLGSEPKNSQSLTVLFGDIFDTYLRDIGGYYSRPTSEIVIGQGYRGTKNTFVDEARAELPRILMHEYVHGLLGTALEDATSPLASRWVNEAATEILSKKIRHGSGENIVEDSVYIHERQLLGRVLKPSRHPIETCLHMSKSFSGTNDDRAAFVQEVDELWGTTDVISKVSATLSFEQCQIAAGAPINRMVQETALNRVVAMLRKAPDTILLRPLDSWID